MMGDLPMKAILVMILVLFLMTYSLQISRVQAANVVLSTWIVDDDGPADFHTIQEAINAASIVDVILVKNGTYYENVVVNKTVCVVGECSEGTIVDGNQGEFVFSITSSRVTVENFTLHNTISDNASKGVGIIANNITGCIIQGNIVNSNYYGIRSTFCSNLTIMRNIVTYNRIGILLESSPNNTVRGNTVHSNLYNGILFKTSSNCIMVENNLAGSNYALFVDSSNDCVISNNMVERAIWDGIYSNVSSNVTVSNNTVTNSGNRGIVVQNCMICSVTENIVRSAIYSGLELFYSNNCTAANNILSDNYNGITLEQTNNSETEGNEIRGSSNGIYLCSCENDRVNRNLVENSSYYGLSLLSTGRSVINANSIKDSRYYGIRVYDSSENILFHNNFVNIVQASVSNSSNAWNSSLEGNYWSNYHGSDQDSNGIGDPAYVINENNTDYLPLLGTFSNFRISSELDVYTICNSTISNFTYEPDNHTIRFNVNGTDETFGFCRMFIPHALINETYNVTIDGAEPYYVNYTIYDDGSSRWIYFAYLHSSHEVTIVSELISPLFLLFWTFFITATTVILKKSSRKSLFARQT